MAGLEVSPMPGGEGAPNGAPNCVSRADARPNCGPFARALSGFGARILLPLAIIYMFHQLSADARANATRPGNIPIAGGGGWGKEREEESNYKVSCSTRAATRLAGAKSARSAANNWRYVTKD